jgi:hypothetical protein
MEYSFDYQNLTLLFKKLIYDNLMDMSNWLFMFTATGYHIALPPNYPDRLWLYLWSVLGLKLLIDVLVKLIYYFRVVKIENTWNRGQILRATSGSPKSWKAVRVADLLIGDMILVKNGSICPADVLVVCTSESLYSEMILYANESKITGRNKVCIKSTVRNIAKGKHNRLIQTYRSSRTEHMM